ncbi:hypothetical protein ACET3Z_006554 [Daucus carota]
MKTVFLIILLVIFITNPSAAGRSDDGRTKYVKLCDSCDVAMKTKIRKILSVVEVLDYRDPGPNPGHDPGGPGKGKPGGKGINP